MQESFIMASICYRENAADFLWWTMAAFAVIVLYTFGFTGIMLYFFPETKKTDVPIIIGCIVPPFAIIAIPLGIRKGYRRWGDSIDTKSLIMLKQELLNAQNRGSHIIVSGHVLDCIKAIASRIIFIKDGLVVQDMRNGDTVNLDYVYKTNVCQSSCRSCCLPTNIS